MLKDVAGRVDLGELAYIIKGNWLQKMQSLGPLFLEIIALPAPHRFGHHCAVISIACPVSHGRSHTA